MTGIAGIVQTVPVLFAAGLEGLVQVKIMRNLPKTALLHLQKYRISVIMSIV